MRADLASSRDDSEITGSSESDRSCREAVAVVMIAAMRNPKHAFDRTHSAADAGPDRATYDAADRTCDPVALIGALLRPTHDALGVSDVGNGQ